MESCDFLLTYEIRNREAEAIALITRELEHRGHSVLIREQYAPFFNPPEPVDAKVIVVPAYYRDRVRFYTSAHTPSVDKVVNLQWEQMLSNSRSGSKDTLAAIKPWGYGAVHLSWGQDNMSRLVDVYGVPQDHVFLTGHVGMDYLRPQLRNYYLSREELCSRYGLPSDKEICLFISSFAITTMHDRFFEGATLSEAERKSMYAYRDTSIQSQATIIEWFDKLLDEDDSKVVVYRPHPEEKDSPILRQMEERHKNFYVIGELSVKQWIVASDHIFTWVSTSVVEVYFAGKTCHILNPLPLPEQVTMALYENASVVTDYDGFRASLHDSSDEFPIPKEDITRFYMRDEKRLSCDLICDVLEQVLQDATLALDEPLRNPFTGVINAERVACFIKRLVSRSRLCALIHDRRLFSGTVLSKNIDDVLYVKEKLAANHVSDEEFAKMIARIDGALAEEDTPCT